MPRRLIDDARIRYTLVLLVCAALYWPLLGAAGFGSSEGHRVVPAWTMLDSGDWFHIEMFGATYLRKPPGFPWAIALSSMIFGQTEFAARAVSALACTLMAIIATWFGSRWFSHDRGRYGLAAGIVQAISPQFVSMGRVAEIDALNALGTQLACLAMIDLLMSRNRRTDSTARPPSPKKRTVIALVLLCATGIAIAALAKGPASLTCVLAVPIAAAIVTRSTRVLISPRLWIPIALAAMLLAPLAWQILRSNPSTDAVLQDFSEFTWSASRIGGVLLFIPAAFAAALPASLALFIPAIDRLRGVKTHDLRGDDLLMAPAIALAWLLAVGFLMLAGISNARYAMPAAVLLAPLAAYACSLGFGVAESGHPSDSSRRSLARTLTFGHPLILPILLVPLLLWWAVWRETYRERREEGRRAGGAIAALLPQGAPSEVWANDLIEARPDVLLYATMARQRMGLSPVVPLWRKPEMLKSQLPIAADPRTGAPLQFLLVRADATSTEYKRYQQFIAAPTGPASEPHGISLAEVGRGRVASYEFVILQVLPVREER